MPAVSKAQQRFMGMVHAAQKGEEPASPEVAKVAKDMSDKSAKDFASTKHKGLPDHVKESEVTDRPEEPNEDDIDLPSAAIPGVSVESVLPTPTNNILWKATGKVCEGRSMAERVRMYEKKGGGWRMGKSTDEQVYNNLKEFYTNEIKPRKEAKELIVKRRMGEAFYDDPDNNAKYILTPYRQKKHDDYFNKEWDKETTGDEAILKGIIKNFEETIKLLKKKLDNTKKLSPASKENIKKSISVNTNLLNTYKQNLKNLSESVLKEDDNTEPGGDVVAQNGMQDHEVSMAKASLLSITRAVQDLMGRLGNQEKDIPGWIQDHITNAENYIVQASKGYYDQEDKKLGNNIPKPENANYATNNGK